MTPTNSTRHVIQIHSIYPQPIVYSIKTPGQARQTGPQKRGSSGKKLGLGASMVAVSELKPRYCGMMDVERPADLPATLARCQPLQCLGLLVL